MGMRRLIIESAGRQQPPGQPIPEYRWTEVTQQMEGTDLDKLTYALFWAQQGQAIRITLNPLGEVDAP